MRTGHSHSHSHGSHGHQHGGHAHLPRNGHGRAFLVSILLNIGFVLIEFVYGILAHSTALLADAGHNLSDVLGLVLAWTASILGQQRATGRYTWGMGSASILAALANAVLLIAACGAIAWEAIERLSNPAPVAGLTVSIVAAIGVAVNGISAWLLMAGSKDDLNLRGAFLHMVADAAVSFGVVAAGLVIMKTQWVWLDPAVSLGIVIVILLATWGLLREAVYLSMNAVPAAINLQAVETYLAQLPGVEQVEDLHVWGISTTQTALTVRLIMPGSVANDAFLQEVVFHLKSHFRIDHATVQIMRSGSMPACALEG